MLFVINPYSTGFYEAHGLVPILRKWSRPQGWSGNAPRGSRSRSVSSISELSVNRKRFMQTNLGSIDGLLRAIIGIGLISLVFIGPRTLWGRLGVILLRTAFLSWCPVCIPLGLTVRASAGSCDLDQAYAIRVQHDLAYRQYTEGKEQ